MDNKEFAVKLEERTRKFAVRIIRLSSKLPNSPEGRVIRNQITKSGTFLSALITGRPIVPEAKQILKISFVFAKARPAKHNTGSK